MTLADIAIIPLAVASLCENCQIIHNCIGYCPSCAGTSSLLQLEPLLNKDKENHPNEKPLECCDALHAV